MVLKQITVTQFSSLAEAHLGVFGSNEWLSVYGDELICVGIYKDEAQIVGGFYYIKTNKKGVSFVKLPPYTPHCGLWYNISGKNKSSINSFIKEIVTEVATYFLNLKSIITILAFPSSVIDMQPFIWSKYKVIPNYTYQINLSKPIEEVQTNFDSKHRNAINKATKEGVQISFNELIGQDLYDFFYNSLISVGANVYTSELKHILLKFASESNSFCFTAKKEGKLLGAVCCIYDNEKCYYLLGGVDKLCKLQGINNLLVFNSIQKAQQLGCKIFDFEGSMLKGVEKFFRGFGGDIVPYYTAQRAWLPLEIALKFKKRELF